MKRLVIIFCILLVLSVGAIVLTPGFIDWNTYRDQIAQQIEDAIDRDVTIGGRVDMRLLPSPSLVATDVRIAGTGAQEGEEGAPLLQFGEMRIKVLTRPLFLGQIRFATVHLVEPVLTLDVDEDGNANWSPPAAAEDAPPQQPVLSKETVMKVRFDQITVEKGAVAYANRESGAGFRVDNINLKIVADTLFGPYSMSGDVTMQETPLDLEIGAGRYEKGQPVALNISLKPKTETGAELRFNGILTPTAAFELKGDVSSGAGVPTHLLKAIGLGDLPLAQGRLEDLRAVLTAEPDRLQVTGLEAGFENRTVKGELTLSARRDARPILSGDVTFDRTILSADGGFPFFGLPRNFDSKLDLDFKTVEFGGGRTLTDVSASIAHKGDILTITSLKAGAGNATSIGMAGKYDGKAKKYDLDVQLQSGDFRALAWKWTDGHPVLRRLSDGALKELALDAKLDLSKNSVKLSDIAARIDGKTDVTGRASRLLSDKKTAWETVLQFTAVDLADYRNDTQRGWIKAVLRALQGRDYAFDYTFDRLKLEQGDATGFRVAGRVDGKGLFLTALDGNLYGAGLTLSGKIGNAETLSGLDLIYDLKAPEPAVFFDKAGAAYPEWLRDWGMLTLKGKLSGDPANIEFSAEGGTGDAEIVASGTYTRAAKDAPASYTSTLRLKHPDTLAALSLFGIGIDDDLVGRPGKLDFYGEIANDGKTLKIGGIQSTVGETSVTGDVTRAADGKLDAELQAGRLDFDTLLDTDKLSARFRRWRTDKFDPPLPQTGEIALQLNAKEAVLNGVTAVNPALSAAFRPDGFTIKQFDGETLSGAFSATAEVARIDPDSPGWRGKAEVTLSGIAPPRKMLDWLPFADARARSGDFHAELSGEGTRLDIMRGGATGAVDVVLSDGTIAALNAPGVYDMVAALNAPPKDFERELREKLFAAPLEFSELSLSLDIGNGDATITNAALDTKFDGKIAMTGKTDISNGGYDTTYEIGTPGKGVPGFTVYLTGEAGTPPGMEIEAVELRNHLADKYQAYVAEQLAREAAQREAEERRLREERKQQATARNEDPAPVKQGVEIETLAPPGAQGGNAAPPDMTDPALNRSSALPVPVETQQIIEEGGIAPEPVETQELPVDSAEEEIPLPDNVVPSPQPLLLDYEEPLPEGVRPPDVDVPGAGLGPDRGTVVEDGDDFEEKLEGEKGEAFIKDILDRLEEEQQAR